MEWGQMPGETEEGSGTLQRREHAALSDRLGADALPGLHLLVKSCPLLVTNILEIPFN